MSSEAEQHAVLGQPASEPHQASVVGEPHTADSSPVIGEPLFPNGVQKTDINVVVDDDDDADASSQNNLTSSASVNGVYADHSASDSSPDISSAPVSTDSSVVENTSVAEESEAPVASSVESLAAAEVAASAEEISNEVSDKEIEAEARDGAQERTVVSDESELPAVEEKTIATDDVTTEDHNKEAETQVHGNKEEEKESEAKADDEKGVKEEVENRKESDDVVETASLAEDESPAEDKISEEKKQVTTEGVTESTKGTSEKEVPPSDTDAAVTREANVEKEKDDAETTREEDVEKEKDDAAATREEADAEKEKQKDDTVATSEEADAEKEKDDGGEAPTRVEDNSNSNYRTETVENSEDNGEVVIEETEKAYAEETVDAKKDVELTKDDLQKQTNGTEHGGAEGGESLQQYSSDRELAVTEETGKAYAEETVDAEKDVVLTKDDLQKQTNGTEYGSAEGGESLQQYSSDRELAVAANGENGFQCVHDTDDPSAEKEQDFSDGKEQSSLRFIKLPLIFTGLAIAAAGIAFASISRASLGSK